MSINDLLELWSSGWNGRRGTVKELMIENLVSMNV